MRLRFRKGTTLGSYRLVAGLRRILVISQKVLKSCVRSACTETDKQTTRRMIVILCFVICVLLSHSRFTNPILHSRDQSQSQSPDRNSTMPESDSEARHALNSPSRVLPIVGGHLIMEDGSRLVDWVDAHTHLMLDAPKIGTRGPKRAK